MSDVPNRMQELRQALSDLNREILDLVGRRIALVDEMRALKLANGLPMYDPVRESRMFEALVEQGQGILGEAEIRSVFRPIFEISLAHMEGRASGDLRIGRRPGESDRVLNIKGGTIGVPGSPAVIAGPCAVESEEQLERTAAALAGMGIRFLRGGAFKPRTSPDAFQGLGIDGVKMLRAAADRHGLAAVTEVTDPRQLEDVAPLTDILQIGARNMANYALLQEAGRTGKPVLLKRAFAATIDEFLLAAEYLAKYGSSDGGIILCERGIRTFERETRFTLDVSAIPILRQKTALPVIADVSHAAGRRDLIAPLAKAALAAGASGLMLEVHPCPEAALSDASQQLSIQEFQQLLRELNVGVF